MSDSGDDVSIDDVGLSSGDEELLQSMGFTSKLIGVALKNIPYQDSSMRVSQGGTGGAPNSSDLEHVSQHDGTTTQEDHRPLTSNTTNEEDITPDCQLDVSSDLISYKSYIFSDVNLSSCSNIEERTVLDITNTQKNKTLSPFGNRGNINEECSSEESSQSDDPDYLPELDLAGQTAEELNMDEDIDENNECCDKENNNIVKDNKEEDNHEKEQPKKLRKKDNKQNWKKNVAYDKRQKGEAYIGYRRCNPGKVAHDIEREAKVLGPRCQSVACIKSKLRACNTITEDERLKIFNGFWKKMSWDQRKVYVVSLLEKVDVSRRRSQSENSRWSETLKIFPGYK
ncbi:uncharacterized protein LOC120354469 isoform X2 [Nilaparvata lugens]|nr:uncharacterized protein LOC120354469 isoform X2 [Nilaparvata lugens]